VYDMQTYSRSDFDRSRNRPDTTRFDERRDRADLHFIGGRSVAKVERIVFARTRAKQSVNKFRARVSPVGQRATLVLIAS
jgi:hypothetical protein